MLGGVLGWLVLVLAWALSPAVLSPQAARSPVHNAAFSAVAASDDATTLGISPSRTYSQPNDDLAPPLAIKWTAPLVADADYAIVAGGRVFATVHHPVGNGSTLFAFDGSTGNPAWSPIDLGGQRSYAGATYDQGELFAVNSDGVGWRLDPVTGTIAWHRSLGTTLSDAPVASGGRLFISSDGAMAFSELDGSRQWSGPPGPFSTLAVSGPSVFSTGNLNAIALDPATGSAQWRYETGVSGGGSFDAAVSNGRLYVSDSPSEVTLNAADGSGAGAISGGFPTFGGSYLFTARGYPSPGPAVHAEDVSSSRIAWVFDGDSNVVGRPVYANGYVFLLAAAGKLIALRADTGAIAWSASIEGVTPSSQLTVGDGLLIVTTSTQMVAFAGPGAGLPAPGPLTPAAAGTAPNSSTDWTTGFQGSSSHSGAVGPDALAPPLARRWTVDTGGTVVAPLIVAGLVVGAYERTDGSGVWMSAYDVRTGMRRWGPVDIGGLWPLIETYDSGRLFAITPDGMARAFDVTNGAPIWARMLAGVQKQDQRGFWAAFDFWDPPVASGGVVLVNGTGDGSTLFALRESDGTLAWRLFGEYQNAPAAAGTNVYLDDGQPPYAAKVDASTGQQLWATSGVVGGHGVPPSLAEGVMYSEATGYSYNASTGAQIRPLPHACLSPSGAGGRYFTLDCQLINGVYSGAVNAYDVNSGTLLWSFTGDGKLVSGPIVIGNQIYVASLTGRLYWVDAASGQHSGFVLLPGPLDLTFFSGEYWNTIAAGMGMVVVPVGTSLVAYSSSARQGVTQSSPAPPPPRAVSPSSPNPSPTPTR